MKAKTKPYHLHWNLYVLPVGRSIELYTGTRHNVIRPNKRHKFMHNSDKNKQIWIFIWLSELDFIRKTIEPPVTKQTTNLTVAQWKSTAISWYETHDFLSTASLFQCPLIFFLNRSVEIFTEIIQPFFRDWFNLFLTDSPTIYINTVRMGMKRFISIFILNATCTLSSYWPTSVFSA